MTVRIGYIGWYGHNNLGDDLTYKWFSKSLRDAGYKIYLGVENVQKVVMGCGTLLNTRYNEFMKQAASCMNRNVPLYIIGTGVQNIDGCFLPDVFKKQGEERSGILKRILDYATVIQVRGYKSEELLKKHTKREVEVCGDLGFLMPWHRGEAEFNQNTVMVNYGDAKGYLYGGDENKTFGHYVEIVKVLLKNYEVLIVPFWTGDISSCKKLAEITGARLRVGVPNELELFDILSWAKIVIGFKLHSLVFGYCSGRYVVPIAYRSKSIDFLDSIGYDEGCDGGREIIRINDNNFVSRVLDSIIQSEDIERFRSYQLHRGITVNIYKSRVKSILTQIGR